MKVDFDEMVRFADRMVARASGYAFDGRMTAHSARYIESCRRLHGPTRTLLIFTRDSGHHSSGWMRNPDYERCLHLSTSPQPQIVVPGSVEPDRRTQALWVRAFFRDHARLAWAESPKTEHGRTVGVWHWRVFCDAGWTPILPRGEVYSSQLTEIGWRSASQVLAEDGVVIESPVDPT